MALLTEFTSYADAHANYSKEALWALFDGDRERFNIGHECLDRHPRDRDAMHVVLAEGGYEAYTFGQLSDWSSRFANYLRNSGVEPGDRVAVMLDPCLGFYASVFGAAKAGCIAVPLFMLFGPDGLRLRVDDCAPKVLVTTPAKAPIAAGIPDLRVLTVDDGFFQMLAKESAEFIPATSARDIALYQYTSGTTRAMPEAVKHSHGSVVTLMLASLYGTAIRPGDRFMIPSSPAWGHGMWHGTIAPFALGVASAAYAGRFDPVRLLEAIQDLKITNLSAAATHYRMMRRSGRSHEFAHCVEKLSFTGEPMDSETEKWARAYFGTAPGSFYGTTEIGVILVSYPGAEDFVIKEGALGRPPPGVTLEVRDAQGNPCPPGVVGEIMMLRRGEWRPTKDLGHTDADGYFYHDGRADDVIITAGYTMGAVEIEDILLKHPDVDEAAVIGVPDAERGQVVKAFIVTNRPGDEDFVKEIQVFTQERLSRHEYPRIVAFAANLPKTPAGKVNRKVLRDREKAGDE